MKNAYLVRNKEKTGKRKEDIWIMIGLDRGSSNEIGSGIQSGMEHGDGARHLCANGTFDVTKGFFVVGGGFGMGELMGTPRRQDFAYAFDAIVMTTMIVAYPFRDIFFIAYIAELFVHFGGLIWYMYSECAANFSSGSSHVIIHGRHGTENLSKIRILAIAMFISHLFRTRVQFHQQIDPPQEHVTHFLTILSVVSLRFAVSTLHFLTGINVSIMTYPTNICVRWREKSLPKAKNPSACQPFIVC